jgi:hypothetical protein
MQLIWQAVDQHDRVATAVDRAVDLHAMGIELSSAAAVAGRNARRRMARQESGRTKADRMAMPSLAGDRRHVWLNSDARNGTEAVPYKAESPSPLNELHQRSVFGYPSSASPFSRPSQKTLALDRFDDYPGSNFGVKGTAHVGAGWGVPTVSQESLVNRTPLRVSLAGLIIF